MKLLRHKSLTATAGLLTAALVLAACGSASTASSAGVAGSSTSPVTSGAGATGAVSSAAASSAGGSTPASSASAAASAGSSAAAGTAGAANISFWGWAPGYADSVKAFNASHPSIQVKYTEVSPGAKGGYEKMLTAVKAGTAPCVAQVGYETMTSFVAQGALQDVTKYAAQDKASYTPAAWNSVNVAGVTYGAPVDVGPMGLFYNKKVFSALGLKPPTTWTEYAADARKIHAANPNAYISSPYLNYDYAGFAWQAGAPWFGIDGDSWKVTLGSDANKKVANYWQGLVNDKLISPVPMWDQAWYKGLGDGSIATVVDAVWMAGVLKSNVAAGQGNWAVAPMPQWNAGEDKVGNVGGSSTAVLKGCANPQAAWTFANWMSTDAASYGNLIKVAGLYPAAIALQKAPALAAGDPYFGGQKIFQVFAAASTKVDTSWVWGPVMTKTASDLDDSLAKAWAGNGTIADALNSTGNKTIDAMKSQGISVS